MTALCEVRTQAFSRSAVIVTYSSRDLLRAVVRSDSEYDDLLGELGTLCIRRRSPWSFAGPPDYLRSLVGGSSVVHH